MSKKKTNKGKKLNMPFDEVMKRLLRVKKEAIDKAISRTKKRAKK